MAAHEFTHGVNYGFNIVQIYSDETGALNEAIADIFGCFIALTHPLDEPEPWIHGGAPTGLLLGARRAGAGHPADPANRRTGPALLRPSRTHEGRERIARDRARQRLLA